MKSLIDSDVLIDATAGRAAAQAVVDALTETELGFSIISCGELFEGVSREKDALHRRQMIETLIESYTVYGVTVAIMRRFATIRAKLRSSGALIADFDIVIDAAAIEHDLRLITRNRRRFERIPDLVFVSPEEALSDRNGR